MPPTTDSGGGRSADPVHRRAAPAEFDAFDEFHERDENDGDDGDDTLDLAMSAERVELMLLLDRVEAEVGAADAEAVAEVGTGVRASGPAGASVGSSDELLDGMSGWGAVHTARGPFRLVPVVPERDLRIVAEWMNDPAVDAFWELAGPAETTERHVRAQLDGDGRSVPCLGVLEGRPMSYWEIYRADLDPLARYYPARPHDTGIHLLIGRVADRGRGLGGALLRAVADHILDHRPACARVVAEPDLRNTASVAAFLTAGFRFSAELDLPGKRAALMVRDRGLRHAM
jgi:RimJ/RimL family protein N-acetyltransferase